MSPRVLNKRTATPAELIGAVYVGRPSKWGNPFKVGHGVTRERAVDEFRTWLAQEHELRAAATRELRGMNLVCWCAPLTCHADVLLEIANTLPGPLPSDAHMRPYQLRIAGAVLKRYPDEAELIVRLGALANALLSIGRLFPEPPFASRGQRQNALLLSLSAASYIYQSAKLMNLRHNGLAWTLAAEGYPHRPFQVMTLEELQTLLAPESEFLESCARIRDQLTFHVDRDPVRARIQSVPDGQLVPLVTLEGEQNEHLVFESSYLAIVTAIPEALTSEFNDRVSRMVVTIPYFVEAMTLALFLRAGLGPNEFGELRAPPGG